MEFAISSVNRLLVLLSRWSAQRHTPTERAHPGRRRPTYDALAATSCTLSNSASKQAAAASVHAPARPLRVTRVLDQGQRHGQAGRMVISGNMSDVCAELDRLSQLDAS